MKISYGITVHNEAEELQKLLEILNNGMDEEDEIVVCVDGDDEKVEAVLGQYLSENKATVYKRKLDGDFSAQKNSVIEKSTGDYIFHIDADEYPHETLLEQLKQIIEMNEGVDFQARVFRRDESIRWTRPLHEFINGCKTYAHLPPQEELSLYHPKTIERQEKQNMFYNQNFSEEMNRRSNL